MLQGVSLADVGFDGVAVKPTEVAVDRARHLDVGTVVVDYEGRDHLPGDDLLAELGEEVPVRVTTPVRADGFDPLGDDSLATGLPNGVGRVVVAGHPAYLSARERERAVAPRLGEAVAACRDPWVGTEGIERLAMAADATQFELLGPETQRRVRALRAAGYDGTVAVYAPTVLADDEDAVLDALGAYATRRGAVRQRLPDDAASDASVDGPSRRVLSAAVRDYGLVGDAGDVADRIADLRDAGVDRVVGYPARGLEPLL